MKIIKKNGEHLKKINPLTWVFTEIYRGENKQREQNKLEFENKQETEDLFISMFIVLRVPHTAKECSKNSKNYNF